MNLEVIRNRVPQTVLKFAIPSIIAMILTSLITIVDGYFIGNYIGKDGIAAVNLGLPMLYIFLALGIMVGVGGSSISGRLLGGKKLKESINVFNQTIFTTLITLVVLSIVMLLLFSSIAAIFNLEELVILYFKKYYFIMIFVYPVMMLNTNLGMFIRTEGRPEVFMLITILSVTLNWILDYTFITVLNLGISGVAFASLISVITGLFCMVLYFKLKSNVFKFTKFKFSNEVLRDTYLNGSSELIGQLSMSITLFVFNFIILREVGTIGVAAFTIVGYVAYIFGMIVIGFGQGASPVISFCYGANEHGLSRNIRRVTNIYVLGLGVLTFFILNLASDWYSNLFVKNSDVQTLVMSGISIFSFAFLFLGVNVITSFYFTSIGKAKESALISASRGLVILLIAILILPSIWGMTGVWLVAPVTEIITILLTLIFVVKSDKELVSSMA